jgi:hypothetical protein
LNSPEEEAGVDRVDAGEDDEAADGFNVKDAVGAKSKSQSEAEGPIEDMVAN